MTLNKLTTETSGAGRPLLLAICLICYAFCGYFSTLMAVYLPVVVRELSANAGTAVLGEVSAYIASMFLVGWMIGGISFGILGDRIGRLKAFSFAVLLYSSLNILIGFTHNWVLIVVFRFISGIGVGGTLVLATVLVAEVWPARSRAIALGILAVTFPVGIVSTGIANNVFPDWRLAFMPGIIPLSAGIIAILFLKESREWTNLKHNSTAAKKPADSALLHSVNKNNIIRGSLIFGTMLIGLWAIFSWMPTWVQSLFPDPASGQKERGITMMLLGGGGIIGGVISGFLVNLIGYKRTLLTAFAGCFILCLLLFKTNRVFTEIIYLESAALAVFFGISQGALSSYLPELFPAKIRSTATGFCFNIGRLATAAVVFFVGTLVTVLGGYGNAVLVFSFTFLVGFAVTLFSPEAKPHAEIQTQLTDN